MRLRGGRGRRTVNQLIWGGGNVRTKTMELLNEELNRVFEHKAKKMAKAINKRKRKIVKKKGKNPRAKGTSPRQKKTNPRKVQESYSDYLKSPRWQLLKDFIKVRDNYKCTACNSEERLNVHHRTYKMKGTPFEKYDLCLLCEVCHNLIHKNRRIDGKIRGG